MKDPYSDDEFAIHMPGQFMPPGLADKLIDLNALAKAGGVNGKDVLNQGPSFPIDEILLGPYAKSWKAIDYDASVIARSPLLGFLPSITFIHGTVASMPPEWTDAFDLVVNFSTLDNIEPGLHVQCLSETARVTRHNGLFLMTYGNNAFSSEKAIRSGNWIDYFFDTPEVEKLFQDAGFHVIAHDNTQRRSSILGKRG